MQVINFSYNPIDISNFLSSLTEKELNEIKILDFAANIDKEKYKQAQFPSDIDFNNELHKIALRNYIEEMGLVSCAKDLKKGSIRNIEINNLSLYWLTTISEKHPQNCALKNLYYFKYISSKMNLEESEISIILPSSALHFQSVITSFLESLGVSRNKIKFNNSYKTNYSLCIYISYLNNFNKKISSIRKVLPRVTENNNKIDHLIFTYYPQTWKGEEAGDYVLKGIETLSDEAGCSFKYFPYFFDYSAFTVFKNSEKFDQSTFQYFPTSIQSFRLYKNLIDCFKKINKRKYDLSSITFVDEIALKHELLNVLHNKLEFVFNHLWLKKYFENKKNISKVFFQDEFYPPGRLISDAIKQSSNETIISYGVQHGLFYEAHTVYSITDNELNNSSKNNGMPIPDYFITWGKYFKDLFLSYNSLREDYVIDAGNLNYILKKRELDSQVLVPNSKTKILWCVSLKIDLINSYKNIIRDFVSQNSSVEIVIRFHPQINLKTFCQDELIEKEKQSYFSYSSHQTIFDAIQESDIVITNSGSTVFLDSLILNKPVFNIVNNDYYMGSLGEKEMKQITSLQDMIDAYNEITNIKNKVIDITSLLNLSQSKWDDILAIA
jgi:hypothetical protein